MEKRTDIRSDKEIAAARNNKAARKILKRILAFMAFIFLIFSFQGCAGLEGVADLANDRLNAVEDLAHVGEDILYEYEDAREVKRYYSRVTYLRSFVNRTCSSYRGEDESGNRFIISPQGITNVEVKAISRRDRDVSVFLIREEVGARDCAGPPTYSGEVDRDGEIILQ